MLESIFSNRKWIAPNNAFAPEDSSQMTFHKIIYRVLCPLSILSGILSLPTEIRTYGVYESLGIGAFGAFVVLAQVVQIVLAFITLFLLASNEWMGVRILIYSRIVAIVELFITLQILYSAGILYSTGELSGQILVHLGALFLFAKYYDRRRLLFSPTPEEIS